MISGALEIIFGVDAGLVHPLLLPASQGPEKFGYIVITYEDSPDVFDILFLRGGRIEEYTALHHDLRTILSEQSVKSSLEASAMRCRVYLFSVTRQGFDRFLRTFHCTPSLNVVIDRLSRKQLSSMLAGIGCKNGILEVDRPSDPFPLIDLSRFYSVEELQKEAVRFRQGRMIVYDLELNSVIRQREKIITGDPPVVTKGPDDEPAGDGGDPPDSCTPPPGGADIVDVFRQTLARFQRAAAGLCGPKLDKRIHRVLMNFFPASGAFEPGMLNLSNAALVLHVIEECVSSARIFEKNKLRQAALGIVKGLYDANHELLRRHGVEEQVQECYRHLEQ